MRDTVFAKAFWSIVLILLVAPALSSRAADDKDAEKKKIDSLIETVAKLDGAKFIRNGTEYDGKAAAEHMRRKLKYAGDKIKTAKEFIAQIASKSSASGQPYKIKFKDGKEQTSEAYLTAELEKLEKKPTEKK